MKGIWKKARARPIRFGGGAGVSRAGQKSADGARRGNTLDDEGETDLGPSIGSSTVQPTALGLAAVGRGAGLLVLLG